MIEHNQKSNGRGGGGNGGPMCECGVMPPRADRQRDGWMYGWIDGWLGGWMCGLADRQTN